MGIQRDHPVRVAVDGRSAAGKTTFADELAGRLRGRGCEVWRVSIDDFHRPGHRNRSRDWTPESYLREGWDYRAFRDRVLDPAGPGGSRLCRLGFWDAFHNEPLPAPVQRLGDHAIVIADCACALVAELASGWEYVIWLDIDFETMLERARERDSAWVGSEDEVERRYRSHWIPLHELYERETNAPHRADALVDNRRLGAPRLVRLGRAAGDGRPM